MGRRRPLSQYRCGFVHALKPPSSGFGSHFQRALALRQISVPLGIGGKGRVLAGERLIVLDLFLALRVLAALRKNV